MPEAWPTRKGQTSSNASRYVYQRRFMAVYCKLTGTTAPLHIPHSSNTSGRRAVINWPARRWSRQHSLLRCVCEVPLSGTIYIWPPQKCRAFQGNILQLGCRIFLFVHSSTNECYPTPVVHKVFGLLCRQIYSCIALKD